MVLKELILTVSTFGGCVVVLKGCGGLERSHLTVSMFGGYGCPERTDLNSFFFGRVWWS